MAEYIRVSAIASGRVQGVGYRYFVLEQADALGLSGWVMNLKNGNVEAELEGPREAVEQVLAALRQGPPASRVADVIVNSMQPTGKQTGFRVRYHD